MGKRSFLVFLSLTIALIFALCDVSALSAQETGSEEYTLEEITVTAQKREENLQKVPIAMEVISAEEIRELGKNDIDEILYSISNAIIEKAQDGYRVTIRGITDNSEAFHGQSMAPPAVAINTDGVYSNRKDTGSGLFDIERVEVLYGPQSTMYSSNSPGGVINVVTAQPKTDRFEVAGSLEVGNYSLIHTEGAVNVPFSERAAMRVSFSTNKRDAYLTSGQDDENTKSARIRTLLKADEKLSFTITGEWANNKGSGFGGGVEAFGDESDVDNPWTGVQADNKGNNDQTTKKISGQINWDTSVGTLVLTPSYSKRNGTSEEVRGGFAGMEESVTFMVQEANEKGIEARMTSDPDFIFKWIAGGTYYRSEDAQRLDSEEYVTTGTGSWSDRTMTNKNRAVFANITYPIMDAFRITGGYRKSWDTMVSDNEEMRGALPGSGLPAGTLEYSLEHSEMSTDGSPDYKLGIEYDLGPNSMLYADYSTSYRVRGMGGGPGGPPPGGGGTTRPVEGQEGAGSTNTNDPEKLKAYTIGAKNRFFGNKLQLNAAAYYYDYKNYRAGGNDVMAWLWDLDEDLVVDQSNPQEVWREPYANGSGNGRMIGADVSVSAIVTPKDMVNLQVSYIDSEWTDLRMVYYYTYTLVVVEEPTPHTEPVDQLGADFKGKPMMSTPPWNINLTYDHTFNLWNGGTIKTSIYSKFKTSYDLSWRESDYPMNYQESYHMEDFNAVYSHPNGRWNLSAYVKNIFEYAEKRMIMNAGGAKLLSIGNPRTYGAVLSVKF